MSSTFLFGKNLQFTHFIVGLDTLAFYGFFSLTMFGAIYFIVPRITGAGGLREPGSGRIFGSVATASLR